MFDSPLRYPGGKHSLYPIVSKIIRENNVTELRETFAGGAGLGLKLLFNSDIKGLSLNDADPRIARFWGAVLHNTEAMTDFIDGVHVTIETWEECKYKYNNFYLFPDIEIAQAVLFLNRVNVGGILKGGVIGGKEQKGKYKMDVRFNRDELIRRVEAIGSRSDDIFYACKDGTRTRHYWYTDFSFVDPPYFEKSDRLYGVGFNLTDHVRLAEQLNYRSDSWILTYDNHPRVQELYPKRRKMLFNSGKEVMVFSDDLELTSVYPPG